MRAVNQLPWEDMEEHGRGFYNIARAKEYELPDYVKFVFGSNTRGYHGAGAARDALIQHGAILGVASGLQGNAYGITTKDHQLRTLPLSDIRDAVASFVEFTKENEDMIFFVTAVGTGYAGIPASIMAPMFEGAQRCFFPGDWQEYLNDGCLSN